MLDRDHPDIEWCECTGYPRYSQPETLHCERCDCELHDDDDIYNDEHYELLCEECLLSLHTKRWFS